MGFTGLNLPTVSYSLRPGSMHISLREKFHIAPAKDAIAYESQLWDHTNIYFRNGSVNPDRLHKEFGPPSQESDDAWADLIQCKSFHYITSSENNQHRLMHYLTKIKTSA
jgi:hypothetical protein